MAIIITEECINCGACEPECPNTAIYEGGIEWTWAGGTSLTEVELEDGSSMDAKTNIEPVSEEFYYIVLQVQQIILLIIRLLWYQIVLDTVLSSLFHKWKNLFIKN